MIQPAQNSPLHLPAAAVWALRPLPLLPLRFLLQRLAGSITRRHPELHERLHAYRGRSIGICPTDAPFAIVIEPRENDIALRVDRGLQPAHVVATIRGPLLALLGLLDGSYDGDALFFSRDITVDGDIGAVLALRNAVDDAQIDLLDEAAASFGPLGSRALDVAKASMRSLSTTISRHRRTAG